MVSVNTALQGWWQRAEHLRPTRMSERWLKTILWQLQTLGGRCTIGRGDR